MSTQNDDTTPDWDLLLSLTYVRTLAVLIQMTCIVWYMSADMAVVTNHATGRRGDW